MINPQDSIPVWTIQVHKGCYGWIAPTDLTDICKQEYSQRIPCFFIEY